MSSKEDRQKRWARKKAHKVRKAKGGMVSGNARYKRRKSRDLEEIDPKDRRMGRASEAA